MFDANVKLIEELKEFVSVVSTEPEFLNHFRFSERDFIRTRKLPFDRLVFLIAGLCKKTLSVEIEGFWDKLSQASSCSVSAFVQQRTKLNPRFFGAWNSFLCDRWYALNEGKIRRWKGYRVVAADGSNAALVNQHELINYFGGQRNQQCFFTVAKTFYYYDVLNELVLLPWIGPYRKGELSIVYEMTERTQEDMLLIYDRCFSNYKVIALHLWQ